MQRFRKGVFFLAIVTVCSCTKDKLPVIDNTCEEEYTYTAEIKPIIDKSCAYTGCHVAGFGSGNHTTYNTLKPQLDNGRFKVRAIDVRTMPPLGVESSRELTDEDIEKLNCWAEAGYPE